MNVHLLSSQFAMPTGLCDWLRITHLARIATFCIVLVAASKSDLLAQCVSCDSSCCSPSGGHCGCGGCGAESLWTRDHLFGDWLDVRPCLAEHGIIADLQLTQFYQGVASGGVEQTDAYGGKLDYNFTFLSQQMGLWKGGTLLFHAETNFGENVNADAGAFALPNTNLLWPLPGENETSITGLLYLQKLSDKVSVGAGKLHVLDFWTMVYPNVGRGVDGFMNLNSLSAGLPWLRFVNLSVNAAGVLVQEGEQIQGGVLVFDLNNSSTTSGLGNLFDDGAGVLGLWRFFTDWNGKPGSHLFAGSYANRTYTSLDETSWFIVPGQGVVPGQKTGAWALGYYFQQVVWADRCNEARKVQLWTGWGLSDGNPSFARWNGFVSVESYGPLKSREKDRAGVAYFYTELSDDFRELVSPVIATEPVQGVELYYNCEVTPWFHVTADLQFVENGIERDDTAIIPGLRANARF